MSELLCSNQCQAWVSGTPLSRTCTVEKKLTEALSWYFGLTSFRPRQLEAFLPMVHGKDAFVCMPTGRGKALCMFLMPMSVSSAPMGVVASLLVGLINNR